MTHKSRLALALVLAILATPTLADDAGLIALFNGDGQGDKADFTPAGRLSLGADPILDPPPPEHPSDPNWDKRAPGPSSDGSSGFSNFDPSQFGENVFGVAPQDQLTEGDAYWDKNGTYHNKLGDGVPADSIDLNDDGVYTNEELAAAQQVLKDMRKKKTVGSPE